MAKSFKQFQEDIEFLKPASYDKKLLDTMIKPSVEFDSKDTVDTGFRAGKDMSVDHTEDKPTTVKGNPEMPVIAQYKERNEADDKKDKSAPSKLKEDVQDVENVYVQEVEDLLEEVADLFESLSIAGFESSDHASAIAANLRSLRDSILSAIPRTNDSSFDVDVAGVTESEQLDELSKKTLKSYVKKANKSIDKEIKKGDPKKKAFNRNQGVERAQDRINEAFTPGHPIALQDGSKVTLSAKDAGVLNKVFESPEAKALEKTMMKNIHEFKSVLEFAKSLNEEETCKMSPTKGKSKTEINASAEDADENKEFADGGKPVVEGELQEVSKKKLEKYIPDADEDREYANTKKTVGDTDGDWARVERNRKKGIKLADKKLDGKAKVNVKEEEDIQEVSKKTLGSYVKKAQEKQRGNTLDAVHHNNSKFFDADKRDESNRKYHQTDKFVKKAVDKIVKEDLEESDLNNLTEEDLELVLETYSDEQLTEIINEGIARSTGIGAAVGAGAVAAGRAVFHGAMNKAAGGSAIIGAYHGAKSTSMSSTMKGAAVGAAVGAAAHAVGAGVKKVAQKVMNRRTAQ